MAPIHALHSRLAKIMQCSANIAIVVWLMFKIYAIVFINIF